MNKEILNKGNSLIREIEVLNDLNSIMCVPYPLFSSGDKDVNSVNFDKETLNELRNIIWEFIGKRKLELQKEFEAL